MATPETLIEQTEEGWQTMALAGTQKIEKECFSSLKAGESPTIWQLFGKRKSKKNNKS